MPLRAIWKKESLHFSLQFSFAICNPKPSCRKWHPISNLIRSALVNSQLVDYQTYKQQLSGLAKKDVSSPPLYGESEVNMMTMSFDWQIVLAGQEGDKLLFLCVCDCCVWMWKAWCWLLPRTDTFGGGQSGHLPKIVNPNIDIHKTLCEDSASS